jgi:hypothetical protein
MLVPACRKKEMFLTDKYLNNTIGYSDFKIVDGEVVKARIEMVNKNSNILLSYNEGQLSEEPITEIKALPVNGKMLLQFLNAVQRELPETLETDSYYVQIIMLGDILYQGLDQLDTFFSYSFSDDNLTVTDTYDPDVNMGHAAVSAADGSVLYIVVFCE